MTTLRTIADTSTYAPRMEQAVIDAARALLRVTDGMDASRSRIATHHEREDLRRALAELDKAK
jgi:hypothetical protein